MTLYLSLLLRRFYSNIFLAQHSRTTNISMNFIKLASTTGASNLLSRTPSTPLFPGSKKELLSRRFKASLLAASSISFPFAKAVAEKLKMLQANCPESFSCCAVPRLSARRAQRLRSRSRRRLWPRCSRGDCSFPSPGWGRWCFSFPDFT